MFPAFWVLTFNHHAKDFHGYARVVFGVEVRVEGELIIPVLVWYLNRSAVCTCLKDLTCLV
jgi:hypothetical protein